MTATATPSAPVNGALLVDPRFEDLFRQTGLVTIDDLFEPKLGTILGKPGLEPWRERIRFSPDGKDGSPTFYAKRYLTPPARARREIARWGSGARSCAGVEWAWLNRLQTAGIGCAEPVAFSEEFRHRRELRSVLVTREVPGKSLETWCGEWSEGERVSRPTTSCRGVDNRHSVREIAHQVAQVIARLHAAGLFHRDLYLCHVFHDPSVALNESVRLIDLQRVIEPSWGLMRWRIKDLAALNYSTPGHLFSKSDRTRWFKQYLGLSRLNAEARCMIYRIVGKTATMAEHDRRRKAKHDRAGAKK